MDNGMKALGVVLIIFILRSFNILNFEWTVYVFLTLLVVLVAYAIDKLDWDKKKK